MSTAHETATEPYTTAYKKILAALNTDRSGLSRDEREAAIVHAKALVGDLECELWGDQMGWPITDPHEDKWMEMYRAYVNRFEY